MEAGINQVHRDGCCPLLTCSFYFYAKCQTYAKLTSLHRPLPGSPDCICLNEDPANSHVLVVSCILIAIAKTNDMRQNNTGLQYSPNSAVFLPNSSLKSV